MDSFAEDRFTFPDCWKDDVRMDSLFAPFKPRIINPSNYESKMNFWVSLIEKWCMHHKTPQVDFSLLTSQFARNGKYPSCLDEVAHELQMNKTLITKEVFYQMVEKSWTKWAIQALVANPLRSTCSFVENMIVGRNKYLKNHLLHLPVIKKLGEEVIGSVPETKKGKLMDLKDFNEICSIKSTNLEIVLDYLASQKLVTLHKSPSGILVKFPKWEGRDLTITEVDKALHSLENNIKFLERNVDRLEEKRKHHIEEARKYVSAKNIIMAKNCLKRSKMAEEKMKKLLDGIGNVESLIYQMEMTDVDSLVMDCYRTGVKSLKEFLKESKLTKESVDNVRDELEDYLTLKLEIDETIMSPGKVGADEFDEAELEELMDLLVSNEPEELQFPEVPEHDPERKVGELQKKLASLAL